MKSNDKAIKQVLLAVDQVSDAIVIVSPDNKIKLINDQFLYLFPGPEKSDFVEMPAEKLIHHLSVSLEQKNNYSAPALTRCVNAKIKSKETLQIEFKNIGGKHLRYRDQVSSDGHRIGIFTDESSIIALHKQFETACDEAEKLSNAKNSFMAAMSHEVKTPLNAIIGMLDLCVLDDYIAQNEYIQRIQNNADKLLSLINNVLDFAKFDAHKVKLSEVPTNIRGLCESIVEGFAGTAEKSKTTMQLFVDPRIPETLLLDDIRISQVLNNLISNGLKFNHGSHPKLLLDIEYDEQNNSICCRVTDNGIGITEEQQKYVFAGFEQASTDTHRRFGGSGLGLSICQRISWLMKGSLSVSSDAGKGTTFTFKFPLPKDTKPVELDTRLFSNYCLSSNDPVFFKSLSKYRPFFGFKTKFYKSLVENIAENEYLFVTDPSPEQSFEPSTDKLLIDVLNKLMVNGHQDNVRLLNRSAYHCEGAGTALGIKTISHTPLLLNELLQLLQPNNHIANIEKAVTKEKSESVFEELTALVVEDNPDNMFVFKRQLQKLSVSADFALDPLEAETHFKHKHYDIVLSDYQMPGMSGAQLIEKLRKIEKIESRTSSLMFIITADRTDSCKSECALAGANDVLMKPLTIMALSELFNQVNNKPKCLNDESIYSYTVDEPAYNLDVLADILGDTSPQEQDEFLVQYEVNLEVAVADIIAAADIEEWSTLGSLAHSLKSSALIIGAKPLSEACSQLENVCEHQQDIEMIKSTWQQAKVRINELKIALSKRK